MPRQSTKWLANWRSRFPHSVPRDIQEMAMDLAVAEYQKQRGIIFELPTGVGKTPMGICFLEMAHAHDSNGAVIMVTSTKSLVNQIATRYPNVQTVYGRNEYSCQFYRARGVEAKADEVPCLTLVRQGMCPHYVPSLAAVPTDVAPCDYYLDKAKAEEGGRVVVCTMSSFLLNKLFQNYPEKIVGLVIDEADKLAEMARLAFRFDITDYHLKGLITLLGRYDTAEAERLREFLEQMIKIAQLKPARKPSLLQTHEIELLLGLLERVSFDDVSAKLGAALSRGEIDPVLHQEELAAFEQIANSLRRYIHAFRYALAAEERNPLNFIFAYYEKRIQKTEKVRYRLCVQGQYVAGLLQKALADARHVLVYSATVGKEQPFRFETGMDFPIHYYPSPFPEDHAKIYLASDTPNLAFKERKRTDASRTAAMMTEAARQFQEANIRILVIVESEKERERFLELAQKSEIDTITYGEGMSAREALQRFQNGEGMVLVGTAAHYSRGVDLPEKIAEVTLALRPGWGRPDDPATQFEELRYKKTDLWPVRIWRVVNEVRQIQGRNIRGPLDRGVTILFSQAYRKILPGGLPSWLQSAWVTGKNLTECVTDALAFLKK